MGNVSRLPPFFAGTNFIPDPWAAWWAPGPRRRSWESAGNSNFKNCILFPIRNLTSPELPVWPAVASRPAWASIRTWLGRTPRPPLAAAPATSPCRSGRPKRLDESRPWKILFGFQKFPNFCGRSMWYAKIQIRRRRPFINQGSGDKSFGSPLD